MISVLDTQDQVLALVQVPALSAEEDEGVEVEALVIKNIFYFPNTENEKNLTSYLVNISTRF